MYVAEAQSVNEYFTPSNIIISNEQQKNMYMYVESIMCMDSLYIILISYEVVSSS